MKDLDLVTMSDAARRLGVALNTVWRWSRREDFPEPVGRIGGRPVWRWRDLERFAAQRPRRGRPKPPD